MKCKRMMLSIGICVFPLLITGCWDHKELNDQAIWLATGWDVGKDGGIKMSGQIVIPANIQTQGGGGGMQQKGFLTISAEGMNVGDALENIQSKLPRNAFLGQRRVVFFGEKFAKRGLKYELDVNNRSPDVSFRTDVFVVKGATAEEALNVANPLEGNSAIAALKEHEQSGGRGATAYLNFLMAANSDGFRPTIPVIEISTAQSGTKSGGEDSANPPMFRLSGVAVFNKNLEMIGYLNNEENRHMLWVMGMLKKMTISIPINNGNASMVLTKMDSDIKPEIVTGNKVSFTITLKGEGYLQEYNSVLNAKNAQHLLKIQKKFDKYMHKKVQKTVTKVQQKYGMDIFGLGEVLHRKNPRLWRLYKDDWDRHFSEADITVKVSLKIKRIGMTGPSLLLRESEIKR